MLSKKNYLIVGGSGYFGSYIISKIINDTECDIHATYSKNLLFKNERIRWHELLIQDRSSLINFCNYFNASDCLYNIIYLAAYHNPDEVERNKELARDINIFSLETFLNNFKNIESFFFSSSDSVYGESKNNYRFKENDQRNPVNEYGKQKKEAEDIVISKGYNVVRFPFLFGTSLAGKSHFYDHIVSSLLNNKPIHGFDDSYRNALDFYTASDLLLKLIENKISNNIKINSSLNICSDSIYSKYDVMLKIANSLKANPNLIIPVSFDDSSNKIFNSRRAKSTIMDNSKFKNLLSINSIEPDFDLKK